MNSKPFRIKLSVPLHLADRVLEERTGLYSFNQDHYAEFSPLSTVASDIERAKEWMDHCLNTKLMDVVIESNGLIDRVDLPETDKDAELLLKNGYQVVKLKIGNNIEIENLRIQCLLSRDLKVRVDANRSLTLNEAEQIFNDLEIEYAEEPLIQTSPTYEHLNQLEELSMRTGIWYGLDESLVDMNPEMTPRLDGLKALVIKPQLLGLKTFEWIQWAKENKKQIVISSLFETAVGLHHLAILASQVSNANGSGVHGLDSRHLLNAPLQRYGSKSLYKTTAIHDWLLQLEARP